MEQNICSCAIAGLDEMAMHYSKGLHCDKVKVGDPVIKLPWGIPISDKYAPPFNTAIARLMQNGKWRQLSDAHKPDSVCQEIVVDSDTTSLSPSHLLGAYVLSGVLAGIGIIASLMALTMKQNNRRRRNRSRNANGNYKLSSTAAAMTTMNTHAIIGQQQSQQQQQQDDGESAEELYTGNKSDNNMPTRPSPPSVCGGGDHDSTIETTRMESGDYYDFRSAMASLTEDIASLKKAVVVATAAISNNNK